MNIHPQLDWINLTPEDGIFMFGYYDRCPWDATTSRHLALRIPQQDRLPLPGETAEVGYVRKDERRFVKLADTQAWCHQQGAMTHWLPKRPGCFVFNDFVQENGTWRPIARICNAETGAIEGQYEKPIYAMSNDGKWGVSLDFGRIPRRGYSYARAELDTAHPIPADPDAEGLFLIDLESGAVSLIASYTDFMNVHPFPYDLEEMHTWLNHAIFNCDGSRLLVLFRHHSIEGVGNPGPWKTHMMTMKLDGSDMLCSLTDLHWRKGGISHQIWGRTPREVLVDADWCGRGHEYVVFDESATPFRAERISRGMGPAGHLVFSPDGQWLAADTYAHEEWQRLSLVHVESGEWREIGRFHHVKESTRDQRCDLHPRWSRDGKILTVDTIHEGDRKIFLLDMTDAQKLF